MTLAPNTFNTRQLLELAEFITIIDEGSSYDIDFVERTAGTDGFDLRVDKNAPVDLQWYIWDQDVVINEEGVIKCSASTHDGAHDIEIGFTREVPMTAADFARVIEEQAVHEAIAG